MTGYPVAPSARYSTSASFVAGALEPFEGDRALGAVLGVDMKSYQAADQAQIDHPTAARIGFWGSMAATLAIGGAERAAEDELTELGIETIADASVKRFAGVKVFIKATTSKIAALKDGLSKIRLAEQGFVSADKGATELAESKRLLAAPNTIKHHIFSKFRGSSLKSQIYRDFFKEHGIDVDKYTLEIPESMHREFIHKAGSNWTTKWKRWIDTHPNATTKEVYQFAGQMMDEYGLSGLRLVPYK